MTGGSLADEVRKVLNLEDDPLVKALCTSWRGESLDGDDMLERQLRSTQEYVAAFGIRVEMRRVPEQVSRKMEGRLARVIQAAHGHDG